jgi:hypothetical protein
LALARTWLIVKNRAGVDHDGKAVRAGDGTVFEPDAGFEVG